MYSCGESYIKAIESEFDFLSNPQKTRIARKYPLPIAPHHNKKIRETKSNSEEPPNIHILEKQFGFKYASLLGKLMFTMVSGWFDIAYAVAYLAQHSKQPSSLHFEMLIHVTRYLINTADCGIIDHQQSHHLNLPDIKHKWETLPQDESEQFPINQTIQDKLAVHTTYSSPNEELAGYSDSDWAFNTDNHRSQTGTAITYNGSIISFASKLQPTVALSSCEAEMVALVDTAKQIKYIQNILRNIN